MIAHSFAMAVAVSYALVVAFLLAWASAAHGAVKFVEWIASRPVKRWIYARRERRWLKRQPRPERSPYR